MSRYVSAEKMSKDDFGIPFTHKKGEVVYDAKLAGTTQWATMTQISFDKFGDGRLGLGLGQKYVRNELGELHKMEG